MKSWLIAPLALFFASALSAARIDVVAANAIVADWVQAVGGDQVAVTTLAPAGSDPHHFSPSPRQVKAVAQADLIVAFGAGMEPWLKELADAAGSRAKIVELTHGLDLMPPKAAFWETKTMLHPNAASKPPCCKADALRENEIWAMMAAVMPAGESCPHDHASPAHGEHDHHTHDHGELDPHAWLDPQLALQMVLAIDANLAELAPDRAADFQRNRRAYLEALIELDEWAEQELAAVPVERRLLINHHDNLRYFGRRYGFFTPASILGSTTTESADPSAKQFTELIELIRVHRAPAVFVDATANPRLARQLAREAGLPPPVTLHTGNLTGPQGPAPTYLDLMRANVQSVAEALR